MRKHIIFVFIIGFVMSFSTSAFAQWKIDDLMAVADVANQQVQQIITYEVQNTVHALATQKGNRSANVNVQMDRIERQANDAIRRASTSAVATINNAQSKSELQGRKSANDTSNTITNYQVIPDNWSADLNYHAQYDVYYLLNDNEKWAFDGMIGAIANAETSVTLPTRDLSSLSNSEITQLFSNAWNAIRIDHPEFVWMTKGYHNNNSYERWDGYDKQTKFVVQFSYNELADNPKLHQKEFEDTAERFLNRVRQEKSILAMEQYIFEYFKTSVKYELSSLDQTAYAALVNRSAVCAGVALAVNYILKRLGIPSYYLVGNTSDESHSWNAVKIDEKWYNLDATPAKNNRLTQNTYKSYFNVPYGQNFWATVDSDSFPASRF